jgi:putative PEP-CTERM system histidine kinase
MALILASVLGQRRSWSGWALVMGLASLAGESIFTFLAANATTQVVAIHWLNLSVIALGLAPCSWLLFALTFARGEPSQFIRSWRIALVLAIVASLIAVVAASRGAVHSFVTSGSPLQWYFAVGWPAVALHATFLVTAVVVLMNLEWTFRAAVGTARWSIKYAIIGFALLFGARIYTGSQVVLHSSIGVSLSTINSAALIVGSLLVGFSQLRSRFEGTDIYPSATAIHRSLTAALIGIYLLVVGVLAELVSLWGGDTAFPLKALLLFLTLAVLASLSLSDRLRQRLRVLVSRHFARPLYDYRQVWSKFTDRTTMLAGRSKYCRALVALVSETFDTLSVTLWLFDEGGGRLQMEASTSVNPLDATAWAVQGPCLADMRDRLLQRPQPVNLETTSAPWCETLRRVNPLRFPNGGNSFAMPLVFRDEIVGLLVLGDRVSGLPLTPEDFELLKCIGDQAAANLRNLRLSEKLLELREFEAFQTMSTFFVHDLKNTASTLSLMLRNMSMHFDNPAFREDALRGLSKSVNHLNELITRLTTLRQKLELRPVLGDLNAVVRTALKAIEGQPGITLVTRLEPLPPMLLDVDHFGSVLTNLLLNARDAVGHKGDITVASARQEDCAVISVTDSGCGMSAEFMARSLFRPFQTTKQKGLGIGMFQSKMILEAHAGRVDVQSQPGKGTTFRVFVPIRTQPCEGKA